MVTKKLSKIQFIKISILNDLLEAQLISLNPETIIDPVAKSKYRNLLKSCSIFTSYAGTILLNDESREGFGELCDGINKGIDKVIKEVLDTKVTVIKEDN